MGEETEAREGGDKREHPRKNQAPGAPHHHHSGRRALTFLGRRSSATSASDPRSVGSSRSVREQCLQENKLGEQAYKHTLKAKASRHNTDATTIERQIWAGLCACAFGE